MFKTRVTELFGIEYPVVQGGLMWIARAELVAAVGHAGGVGFLTALAVPAHQIAALLHQPQAVRKTQNPGCNQRRVFTETVTCHSGRQRSVELLPQSPGRDAGRQHRGLRKTRLIEFFEGRLI